MTIITATASRPSAITGTAGMLAVFFLACCLATPANAMLMGLKSAAPTDGSSSAPTSLFSFNADGTGFAEIRRYDLDLDALAINGSGDVYAFQRTTSTDTRLVKLSDNNSWDMLFDPFARDIRGAAFGPDGRLWVVDAQANEVFAIDASTGTIDAASIQGLNKNGEAFNLSDASDIAFRADGTAYLSDGANFYTLDIMTGLLTLSFTDTSNAYPGIAFDPADSNTLFGYEVNGPDDIYAFDLSTGIPQKSTLLANILPAFNSGRGDLASQMIFDNPAGPTPVPLPSTIWLVGLALVGLSSVQSRARRKRVNAGACCNRPV